MYADLASYACPGPHHQPKPKQKKRLLVLDGGGVRGLYTAATLAHLEMKTGKKLKELFDAVVGTSTGGLLALLVAHRSTTSKLLVDTFTKGVTEIFHKKHKRFKNRLMMGPKYSPKGLLGLMREATGIHDDVMLNDPQAFTIPVGVTTVNVETNAAELINSVEEKYAGIPALLAAQATSAVRAGLSRGIASVCHQRSLSCYMGYICYMGYMGEGRPEHVSCWPTCHTESSKMLVLDVPGAYHLPARGHHTGEWEDDALCGRGGQQQLVGHGVQPLCDATA